jgi:hypothetical protein
MAGYEIRIEAEQSMSANDLKIYPTWVGKIVYVDTDGTETETGIAKTTWQDQDPTKRRLRAPLNIQLGRLRSHLWRTGKRWEIEQLAKSKAKAAAYKAEKQAWTNARKVAPEMLIALEALLNAIKREKVRGMDATVAQAERAVARAKGCDA